MVQDKAINVTINQL